MAHTFNRALREAERTETHTFEASQGYTGVPVQSGLHRSSRPDRAT